MPPIKTYQSMYDFVDCVNVLQSSGAAFDDGYHIRYEDLAPAANAAYMHYFPGIKALVAHGLSIVHFDRFMQLFDVFDWGIPLKIIALAKSEFRASTFSHIVSVALENLIINNVHLYETIVPLEDLSMPWAKTPAYWHDVLPIFAQQGSIKRCRLEGLKDGYTRTNPEHWEGVKFYSDDKDATKLGLMNLAAGWRGAAVALRDPVNEMKETKGEEAKDAPRDEPVAAKPAATKGKKKKDASITESKFACDKCRQHKKGCNNALPMCARCQEKGRTCVYSHG